MSVLGDITAPNVNFTTQWYNENPDAAYQHFLQGIGRAGVDPRSQFYQQQYQRNYRSFLAEVPNQPTGYSFLDNYLAQQQPKLEQEYQSQAPADRGLRYSNYLGHTRYLL